MGLLFAAKAGTTSNNANTADSKHKQLAATRFFIASSWDFENWQFEKTSMQQVACLMNTVLSDLPGLAKADAPALPLGVHFLSHA
jgi:hypothetical protein